MNKVTLYSKQGNKLRQWSVWTEGADVVVEHGQLDGKLTQKRYTAEAKNRNRTNATTPEQQAVVEMEAKVVKQLKSGHFHTKEEALSFEPFEPLKAQPFTDFAHKVKFPCVVQAKFNGQRLMIDKNGNAWSKQGEPLELPSHWEGVRELAIQMNGLDGEIYAGLESEGGLSLQDIISAFRKPNVNTPKLQYWVYDIPLKDATFKERFNKLHDLARVVFEKEISYVRVIPGIVVDTPEQAHTMFEYNTGKGYEGLMYRNLDGLYEFGKRSYDLIKRKMRLDAEAKPVSYEIDKNEEPVYNVEALNGIQKGVVFKLKMKKPYRGKDSIAEVMSNIIRYEYEELGDDKGGVRGKPTKPVGVDFREMKNEEGRW